MPEAKARVSYREFLRFRLYKQIQPFGDDWKQAGVIAATVSNSAMRKGRAAKWQDFCPQYRRRPQSAEDQWAALEMFAKVHNARIKG